MPTIRKAWVTVAPSGIKNAGLGLFAATRFYEGNIVTIYFAPNKSKKPKTQQKFMVFKYGHYHTIPIGKNGKPPYYLGAHFINDATWNCEPSQVQYLERSNNCYWDGFLIRAKTTITVGEELKLGYDISQYTHKPRK